MLRYRRYRVFVVFTLAAVFAFWRFSGSRRWEAPAYNTDSLKQHLGLTASSPAKKPEVLVEETKTLDVIIPAAETSQAFLTLPPIPVVSKPAQKSSPAPLPTLPPPEKSQTADGGRGRYIPNGLVAPSGEDVLVEFGAGRHEFVELPSTISPIYWSKPTEHFPVALESTIQLPTGTPKPIPRIQHTFGKESASAKKDREAKLGVIKEAFEHAWGGYKQFAWGEDELSPISGKSRNPFNGWGATLVDSLDTLWVMGLKDDFEEAVKAAGKIEFTTTMRNDIPLFETTIRYLGGLLAAYDISNGKYKVLLDKAVELAEVLMGAFDTPNRMPLTFYTWKPTFASQPHRAKTHVVLAEIGSLSVEFTRLAQLTKEPKYYDAVARITNAFQEWQNHTRLPGMWPVYVDASGCDKQQQYGTPTRPMGGVSRLAETSSSGTEEKLGSSAGGVKSEEIDDMVPLKKPKPIVFTTDKSTKSGKLEQSHERTDGTEPTSKEHKFEYGSSKIKRQVVGGVDSGYYDDVSARTPPDTDASGALECVEHGLSSPSVYGKEDFTLGGRSDSMYEYLPKQYLLLGGLVEQYRTMYGQSIDVAIDKLLFRPMTPDKQDILVSGTYSMIRKGDDESYVGELTPDGSHLTCFVGGMLAMGAKIFQRDTDLELASKLTDGCIWSYDVMTTGIMPEEFHVVPCDSRTSCVWNESKWWDLLDPYAESRERSYQQQLERMSAEASFAAAAAATSMALAAEATERGTADVTSVPAAEPTASAHVADLNKRQLGDVVGGISTAVLGPPSSAVSEVRSSSTSHVAKPYVPVQPPTHKEFVEARIKEERIPPGFTKFLSKKYILRPEAIESVFYMYRITGESKWREAGWRMFQAIDRHTRTEHGHSAIDDVTKSSPTQLDEMESFWLAETLKYFYLLFSEEDVVSLDEWVFNTEAHPFKRPV